MSADIAPLLSVRDLRIRFRSPERPDLLAVKGVSFDLLASETVAIVGESGSGKSVTALALARLLPEPSARIEGQISWRGRDVLQLSPRELRAIRGKEIAYIFQDPMTSLNPVFSVRSQMSEVLELHRPEIGKRGYDDELCFWLDQVGITNPRARLASYPHELSGGMQQRVMIAMALCGRPSLVVADEPTTALDATVQAQIIDLLARLQQEHRMAILIITHNFHILKNFANRTLVMFRGEIVEQGPTETLLSAPQHAYSRALIECVPTIGQKRRRLATIDHAAL
jgi:ABC-type dipeptide/oligopeptide/nickel transport system ATPase component